MKIKKAIELLKDDKVIFKDCIQEEHLEEFEIAISALEKQLAKEPIEKQLNLKGDLISLCPICKGMWCIKYKEYCANCGQKIDWSGEDE